MASTEDDVVVRLRLKDVRQFIEDVKSGKLAIEDLEKQVKKAGQTASRESSSSGGLGKLASHFGFLKYAAFGAVTSLAAAAGGVAAYAVKSTASLEQVTVAFTTLLHSSSAAKSMVASLQTFAQQTPFELSGVEQTTQRLLAFGFSAKSVIPTLTAIGNAASGLNLGQQGMDEIALVLGQMKSLGRIQGGDLLQLAQHGVNGYGILEKGLGLTPAAFQKAMQAGKVSAATGVPILLRGMEQQYKGLMAKESGTLGGIWSNLHDAIQQGLVRMTSPYLPAMKKWLQDLVDAMPQIEAFLTKVINATIGGIGTTIQIGKQVFAWGQGYASQAKDWASHLVTLIQGAVASGDWTPVGGAIGTAVRNALTSLGGQVGGAAGNVDWYDVGKTAFSGTVTFALGFVAALFDPMVWWGIIKSHWLDVALIAVAILTDGFGGVLGKLGVILSKLPLIGFIGRWIAGLARGVTTIRGPVMKFIGRIGSAIGDAFIKVWPELGTNLWYWFTRIGEFFSHDIPGLKTKVLRWVSDLVPRAVEGMFTAIFKLIDRLATPLRSIAKKLWEPIAGAFMDIITWLTDKWEAFIGPITAAVGGITKVINDATGTATQGGVGDTHSVRGGRYDPSQWAPHQAAGGTTTSPGMSWVGERGPELLNLPRGAQVIPLPRVPEMVSGRHIEIPVVLNGREIARAVYDDMDDRMARR